MLLCSIPKWHLPDLQDEIKTRYSYDPSTGQVFDTYRRKLVNTRAPAKKVQHYPPMGACMIPMHVFIGLLTDAAIDPHNGVILNTRNPKAANPWAAEFIEVINENQ